MSLDLRAVTFAALLLASGCDQVGSSLVGDVTPPVSLPFTACSGMVVCEPPDAGTLPEVLPADEVDVARCGGIGPRDSELCDPSVPVDAGSPESAADAAAPDDDDFVDLGASPNSALLPPCESTRHARVPAELDCADVTSRDAPPQEAAHEQLARAQWHASNLRIESEVPRTIAIDELTASEVWIELRGPVTLRIGRQGGALFTFGSGPPTAGEEAISDLRVTGVATAAGAPQLHFEGVRARGVRIGDDARPFPGRVSARSSELLAVQLLAHDVALESSRLDTGLLRAGTLSGADAVLTDLGIELGHALLANSDLRSSQLTRCGDVSLVLVSVTDSQLSACDAPLRMIDSRMSRTWLDGAVEGDDATFESTLFGTREPTDLVLWSGRLKNAGLCAGVQSLVLAELTGIECSMCERDTFVPDAVCTLPKSDIFLKNNLCPGLSSQDELAACSLPYPDRHRADPRF